MLKTHTLEIIIAKASTFFVLCVCAFLQVQGDAHDIEFHGSKVSLEDGLVRSSEGTKGPWMEDSNDLKSCWSISESGIRPVLFFIFKSSLCFFFLSGLLHCFCCFVDEAVSSKGYVTFSLTNGPEYHVSQVIL